MIKLRDTALKGSFPPLVTPFDDQGRVDFDTYAKLVDLQAKSGSHGIVVAGTTGEPSTLTREERTELLKVAVDAARGRLQVVAATGTQDHAGTVEITAAADKAGADALLIVTPYFIRPPQRGLEAYYLDLAKRTDLPVMIYHIPGRAAVSITAETIERIAEAAPNLVGIKHAVNDLALVSELIAKLGPEFRIHVGLEELSFPMLCLGASGLMNAVGNLMPGEVAELYETTARGDLSGARALHYALYELNQAIFFDTNPIPMKYMMNRVGILPNQVHRLPMVPATPELAVRLDRVLVNARLLASDSPCN
jgi:4-hydroxy-tetrahydrodipicolinate synthase